MSKQSPDHVEKRISKIRGVKKGPSPFRKTTEQIITEIQSYHGDRYLLDRVQYVNCSTKIEVGCREHGYFFKWPNDMKGGGCPKCGGSLKKTPDEFLEQMHQLFPEYEFKTPYKNAHTKIEVVCPDHGPFMIKPNTLLSGTGCGTCGYEKAWLTKIANGQCRDPSEIGEHELYRKAVWRETNQSFNKYFAGQQRNKDIHLDHIVSITDGWANKIPAEIIGSVINLRLINGIDNRRKSNKSDMTVEMLYNKFKEFKEQLCEN